MNEKNGYAIYILKKKISELQEYQKKVIKKYGEDRASEAYEIRNKQIKELSNTIDFLKGFR